MGRLNFNAVLDGEIVVSLLRRYPQIREMEEKEKRDVPFFLF